MRSRTGRCPTENSCATRCTATWLDEKTVDRRGADTLSRPRPKNLGRCLELQKKLSRTRKGGPNSADCWLRRTMTEPKVSSSGSGVSRLTEARRTTRSKVQWPGGGGGGKTGFANHFFSSSLSSVFVLRNLSGPMPCFRRSLSCRPGRYPYDLISPSRRRRSSWSVISFLSVFWNSCSAR